MATNTIVIENTSNFKNEKRLNQTTDIKTLLLLQRSKDVILTGFTTAIINDAISANTFSSALEATSITGTLLSPNNTATSIALTSLFQQISSFFFGRTDGLIPLSNNSNQTTNICKTIFVNRPTLDEGIKPFSVSANISCSGGAFANRIGIIDIPITASTIDMKLGQIGKLVISSSTSNQVGTVFYNYGVMVFHGGDGSATANMFITNSSSGAGFQFGEVDITQPTSAALTGVNINSIEYKTQKYIVRNLYFCRLYNNEFNFTTNPTSKQADGTLIDTIQEVNSSYITTIGLYNDNDECLAVSKISPPVRKHSGNEHIFTVSLDF